MVQITTMNAESFVLPVAPGMAGRATASCGNAQSLGLRRQDELAPVATQLTVRHRGADRSPALIHYGVAHAWFGEYLLAWTEHGICWLSIAPDTEARAELERTWAPATLVHDPVGATRHAVAIFDTAGSLGLPRNVPLHICGSEFQVRVWAALLRVRPGHYVSYGDLAAAVGAPRAARAVGQAVGANGIAVLVPCHRVLAAGGMIGGYRWGSELKVALLRQEVAVATA